MANASQFIGSKISLISKAEIRYEGILYSLDLQEATISLAKVRSFGTEDRPTEKPVPPKDEVYEFIIFRGSDIKGIDVIEPPKAAPTISGGLPNDPAIVEVSHYHTQAQNQFPHTASSSSSGPFGASTSIMGKPTAQSSELFSPKSDHAGGSSVPPSYPQFQATSTQDRPESGHDTSRSNVSTPSAYGSRKSPTNDAGTQAEGGRNRRQQGNNRGQGGDGRRGQQGQGRMSPRQDRQQGGGGGMQRRGGGGQQQQQQGQGGYIQRGRGNYNNNRGGQGYQQQQGGQQQNRGGRGQGRPRGNRTPGVFQAQMPAKVTFEEAFDFEKANAELEDALSKLKLEKTSSGEKKEGENANGEGSKDQEDEENKEPAIFYQKDNFFDNISCEALERSKGKTPRVDWRAEKKLNVETFGVSANNGPRYGGWRGGFRGRGGYSGGGGGYYGYGRGGYQPRGYGYNQRFGGGGRGGGNGGGGNGRY